MTESAISRNTYINLTRGELATVATACPGRTLETIGLDLVFFCEVIDYTHCDKNLDNFRATYCITRSAAGTKWYITEV